MQATNTEVVKIQWARPIGGSLGRLRAIAGTTFLESVRDRTLATPFFLAMILMGAALLTRTLSLGHQAKLLQDLGLAGMVFFSDVLVILAVATSLSREMSHRSILPVLAKPVPRAELVVGKYCGVLGMVLVNILAILGALYLSLLLVGEKGSVGILWAALLSMIEVMVVGALAVLFSVISTPVLAIFFGVATMLVGHTTADLRELAARIGTGWADAVGDLLYYVLPNLELFDVRTAAVNGFTIEPGYLFAAVLYGLLYAGVVLVAASLALERRELV